jgi:hypothetical protein
MTLLFDLEPLTCCQTDHVLDGLYKALGDSPDSDIWQPHHDPWQRDHVEVVTVRVNDRLNAIRDGITMAVAEADPNPLRKADSPWQRWARADFDRVRDYLAAKPRADYTLDDWMLYVDWLIQEYLPDGVIATEAEYLAVRAQIAGKVNATLEARKLTPVNVSKILAVLPHQFSQIPTGVLTEREAHILRFANRETANLITALTAQTRQQMKAVLINGIRRITLGDKQGTWQKLHSELFDTFGDLNRDWRRVAITESGNATNVGYLSTFKPGQKVKREEAYAGCCPFCASIRGKVLTVVADDKEEKDWDNEVWPSKNNVGRSASPRKRVGGVLIPRTPDELWSIPAGTVHPHCRGSWSNADHPPGMSNEYQMWLRGLLVEAGLPATI